MKQNIFNKAIKHNLSLLISIICFISVFLCNISCGNKHERTFSIAYMEIWADSIKYVLMDMCKQWAKENNVKLVSEIGEEWKLKDINTKAAAFIRENDGPDLAMLPNHLTVIYQNDLRELSGVMDEISQNYPGVQNISKEMLFDQGRWIGIPVFSWSHLMVLRKDILDSIGEKVPQTFEDLSRVAKKMNNPNKDFIGLGLGLGTDDDFAMFFQSLLWSFGGSVFDKTGQKIELDRINTRRAVEYILSLYNDKVFPMGALQWDGASNNNAFLGLQTGLTFNSPTIYYVALRKDPALAKKIIHALYPLNEKGERNSYVTGFSFVTRKGNNNKPLVDSFLNYLFRPDNYSKLIRAGGGSVNPAFKGLDTMAIWKDPNLKIAIESMNYEHAIGWPGPVTKSAADVFQQRVITKMFGQFGQRQIRLNFI